MKEQREYRFVIDACSPDTLPMVRLAEYTGELARLLGRLDQVHFVRLEQRSTVLVRSVEPEAAPDVRERLRSLRQGNPPLAGRIRPGPYRVWSSAESRGENPMTSRVCERSR